MQVKQFASGFGDFEVIARINPKEIEIVDTTSIGRLVVIQSADEIVWLINALRGALLSWTEEPKYLP